MVWGPSTHPDIETALDQLKWETTLLVRQADPDLGVHEESVVEIHDPLLDAPRSAVDLLPLLSLPPLQPVHAQEVTIFGLHDVLLCFKPPESAELNKVRRLTDRC